MPAEPLTAEELKRYRLLLKRTGVGWEGAMPRFFATLDARDAALRQAEEERDRLKAALDATDSAMCWKRVYFAEKQRDRLRHKLQNIDVLLDPEGGPVKASDIEEARVIAGSALREGR